VDSISFDPMAAIYDETRVFNESCFNAALDFIVEKYPPVKYPKLFEPGIGTGRMAIPLAERGYSVTGADISGEMLKILAEKLSRSNPPLPVTFLKADITALHFPDAAFDISVATHVFHLVRNWKQAINEVLRVLKPGAPLILVYTGGGVEVPFINDRYRELCAGYGQSAKHIGLTKNAELQEYVGSLGRYTEMVENRWQWTNKVRVDEAVDHIKQKHYGMTHLVSDATHLKAVKSLELELRKQYGHLDIEVEVPHQMRLFFITG
jgi:ubiquinone/menaquinone biosynthesis C-methylase UbiE